MCRVGNPSPLLIIPASTTEQLIVSNSSLLLARREIWHRHCVGLTSQAARRPHKYLPQSQTGGLLCGTRARIITWLALQATNSFVWWPCLHDVHLKQGCQLISYVISQVMTRWLRMRENGPRESPLPRLNTKSSGWTRKRDAAADV
jgi:hypothetical protein